MIASFDMSYALCMRSLHLESAIDVEDLPRDVVRVPRSEEHDRVGHLPRHANPPEEDARLYFIGGLFEEIAGHIRFDDTGSDSVHRDSAGCHLHGERLGEGIDCPFAGCVVRLAPPPLFAGDRTHVDNLACTAGDHVRDHRARYVKDPDDVGVEDSLHVVVLEEPQQVITDNTAVVDKHIDPAAATHHPFNTQFTYLTVPDIDLLCRDPLPCGTTGGDELISKRFALAKEEGDISSLGCEELHTCPPNAAGPARNDDRFLRQPGGLEHADPQLAMENPPSTTSV